MLKAQNFVKFICIAAAVIAQSCSNPEPKPGLEHGDILFQDLNCGALCDAIETVTEGVGGRDFSHCGMVVRVNDTLKVIEAIGAEVRLSSLEDFFSRSNDTAIINNVVVGRLKTEFSSLIAEASAYANNQVGEPYDDVFLLNNGKWYCSELLYESFKKANGGEDFFELAPMTFKDPELNDYFPAWLTYYDELKHEIPEGEPGLNPGSISRSDRIDIIQIDSFK